VSLRVSVDVSVGVSVSECKYEREDLCVVKGMTSLSRKISSGTSLKKRKKSDGDFFVNQKSCKKSCPHSGFSPAGCLHHVPIDPTVSSRRCSCSANNLRRDTSSRNSCTRVSARLDRASFSVSACRRSAHLQKREREREKDG
jgi:hypothetical protein